MNLRRCVAVGLASLTVIGAAFAVESSAAAADSAGNGAMSPRATVAGPTAGTAAIGEPDVGVLTWSWRFIDGGESNCRQFEFCIWWATEFGVGQPPLLRGVAFFGNVSTCEGVNWQGTVWENHVYSIKNNTSGTVTIWNWIGGDINGYSRVFVSPRGNKGNLDLAGGKRADAMAFDPNVNCSQPAPVRRMDP